MTRRRITLAVAFCVLGVAAYFGWRTMRGLMLLGYVDSAIVRMRVLQTAEAQFAKEHPNRGYTCELSELPRLDPMIQRLIAKNKIENGYAFDIRGCPTSNGEGANVRYYLTALPLDKGQPAYCSDQSGVLKTDSGGSVENCLAMGVPL